jgi:hypothetical protein
MRRQHPFLSPVGLGFCFLLFIALGAELWQNGGLAFNPGPLSDQPVFVLASNVQTTGIVLEGYHSHAEFEKDCSLCHQRMQTIQGNLCLDCHTQVSNEIAMKTGLHANVDQPLQCASCHPDHRGRSFDMSMAALNKFDHSKISFSLIHHIINYDATRMDCSSCHNTNNIGYPVEKNSCFNCHARHDPALMSGHLKDFGDNCPYCHDGKDSLVRFNHQNSSFPLSGAHVQVSCAGCHKRPNFKDTPTQCSHCHADPDVHKGTFNRPCDDCHSTTSWKLAILDGRSIDHASQTSFSLIHHTKNYQGQSLDCQTCHPADIHKFDTQTCTACHAKQDTRFMAGHQAQYGPKCLDCHDGAGNTRKPLQPLAPRLS